MRILQLVYSTVHAACQPVCSIVSMCAIVIIFCFQISVGIEITSNISCYLESCKYRYTFDGVTVKGHYLLKHSTVTYRCFHN